MKDMEKLHNIIDSFGLAWDVLVIVIAIIAFLVWLDIFIGNRIRINARSLPGIIFEGFANWYSLQKNIAKARSKHFAFRKKYWVVPIAGRYHVINKGQRQRINKLLRKYHMNININDLLETAVYWTK